MIYSIFDIETDGLIEHVTKIHCLSYQKYSNKELIISKTLTDYNDIIDFITSEEIIVGHNILLYDVPVLEKLLDIKINARIIDTLAISFYHYPVKKFKHGLEAWGEKLGFAKEKVEDWKNADISLYIKRCESDVEINKRLFHGQMDYTMQIYDNDFNQVQKLFKYLSFKLDCIKEQELHGIDLDINLVNKSIDELNVIIEAKILSLSSNMPKALGKILHTIPKNMYKADNTLSLHGIKWIEKLHANNLSLDILEIKETPNPGSPLQLKEWLFQLGWNPITFKESKNTGENVPQISLAFGQGLCKSVKDLFEIYPYLKDLDGLYKAQHRLGIFKSYLLNKDSNNKIYATAFGFTNTLRMQHKKPIANLPGVNNFYGKEIRGSLSVADENYMMCGSDVSGLEDNTKQHYMYKFDAKYVTEMRVPGFDPHIDVGVLSGLLTIEDQQFYTNFADATEISDEDKKNLKRIKNIRSAAKQVNFSCVYGAGAAKIAKALDCSLDFATKLHTTYWSRNKAVKQVAEDTTVKIINGQKWQLNNLNNFWYYLKAEKDRFSTLNQGSGSYVFDCWLNKIRQQIKNNNLDAYCVLQMHDEVLIVFNNNIKDIIEKILKTSMQEVNKMLKLNVEIGISTSYGKNYADCH